MNEDEQSLRKQMEMGTKAKGVLENEAFKVAVGAVRGAILEAWETGPIRDRDGAHELKLMLKLLNDLQGNLKKAMDDGKFAAEELKRDKTITQRIAERLRIA